jgi:hypothetical protein
LRALLEGFYRSLEGSVRRQHHHVEIGVRGAQALHQLDAAHVRHLQIGDDQSEVVALERGQCRGAVLRLDHLMVPALEQATQCLAQLRFVIDDEESFTHGAATLPTSACARTVNPLGSRA